MPSHGYAAFAREDVADAKRGHPASSLHGYAAARGLEWLDRRAAAGFSAADPGYPDHRFNVMRGVLPGGRFGVAFHQLLEVPGAIPTPAEMDAPGLWMARLDIEIDPGFTLESGDDPSGDLGDPDLGD